MRILVVAGARPNFMKVAPVLSQLEARGIEAVLVHTGQHYDAQMSDTFFQQLGIRKPDYFLDVGSSSHAKQTAQIMERFEPVLLEVRPAWVVVVGDVNSTLAAALVASKLREEVGCKIAHIEAGLRSNDWRMPEEVNRVLTDRLSDLLLTPSEDALPNLIAEGINESRVRFVGNVMIDTLFQQLPAARALNIPHQLGVGDDYVVATLHRPSNVDDADRLGVLLEAFARIAKDRPVVFPLHPRTRNRAESYGLGSMLQSLKTTDPLGYVEMLGLTAGSRVVLTDSGGLQEETTALGVPCITLREQTERPVTVTHGTNRMLPWPPTVGGIIDAYTAAIDAPRAPREPVPGWDGRASHRIVDALSEGLD